MVGTGLAGTGDGIPCSYESTPIPAPDIWFGSEVLRLVDVNDAGTAVGWVQLLDDVPCRWSEAEGVKILPMPQGMTTARATAINDNGWILVTAQPTADGVYRGYVYKPIDNGGYLAIPILPDQPLGNSFTLGINDENAVVGLQHVTASDGSWVEAGFLWTPQAGKTTIQVPGWKSTRCTDINDSGVTCGNVAPVSGAHPSATGVRAFIMQPGSVTIVEPTRPYTRSSAVRINEAAVVGGNFSTGIGIQEKNSGFIYDMPAGILTSMPAPPGMYRWILRDINDNGLAVGSASMQEAYWFEPCVAVSGTCVDMIQLIDSQWARVPGEAYAVSGGGVVLSEAASGMLRNVPALPGPDMDGDGVVGAGDLAAVIGAWDSSDPCADLDSDGLVDGRDIGVVLSAWSS